MSEMSLMAEMSPTVGKLFEALAKAQGELGGAKKDSVNPAFKSKYADLESIVDASKLVLPKYGLCIIQTSRPCGKDGVIIVTLLGHSSGEWIRGELFLPASNRVDAQAFGSLITYGRRYGWAAIIGLAPEDDDANTAVNPQPAPQRGPIGKPTTTPAELPGKLQESVGMMDEAVALNERLAKARTVGELMEAWERVGELKKAGLPNTHVKSLEAMKNKRKGELQPQNGSAA